MRLTGWNCCACLHTRGRHIMTLHRRDAAGALVTPPCVACGHERCDDVDCDAAWMDAPAGHDDDVKGYEVDAGS